MASNSPPAVTGKAAVASTGAPRKIAGTDELMARVKDLLKKQSDPYMTDDGKLLWVTPGNLNPLDGPLAEAKALLNKGGNKTITQDQLVSKAADLVKGKLDHVTKNPQQVSVKEVKDLFANDEASGKLVANAFQIVANNPIELGQSSAAATKTAGQGATRRDEVVTGGAAKVNGGDSTTTRSAAGRQKASSMGYEEGPQTAWHGDVQKAINNLPPSVGGRNFMKLLDALDKKGGVSPESVADQLISGKGPVADLFAKGGKHELTTDAILALTEKLKSRPRPDAADKRQVQEYMDRLEGLVGMTIDPRRSAIDYSDPSLIASLRGRNGDAQIDPAIYRQAQAAVGPNGVLTEQAHHGLTGILRQAADFLRMLVGPTLAITCPMLMMAASQIFSGLPMVMGMPYAGYQYPNAYSTPSLFRSLAMPFMMNAAQSIPAMAMGLFGGGRPPMFGAGTFTPWSMSFNPSNYFGSNDMTTNMTVMQSGFMPTGNGMFDLANCIANAPTYSATEQALLSRIKDPEQRAIQELQMQMQKQALMCTTLTNLANMRHEMLKAVAQNLRG